MGTLRERLDNANRRLAYEANLSSTTASDAARLRVTAEGVRLALSYVDEALRMTQPAEEAQP